jgi:hypothetical protein
MEVGAASIMVVVFMVVMAAPTVADMVDMAAVVMDDSSCEASAGARCAGRFVCW